MNVARIGDGIFGIHYGGLGHPHPTWGTILTGSGNVLSNGRGDARIGDLGVHIDGAVVLLVGSGNVLSNGLGTSRLGDFLSVVPGPGSIVTASGNVLSNG